MSPRRPRGSRRPGWPILLGIAVAAGVLGTIVWLASEGQRRGPADTARPSSGDPGRSEPAQALEPAEAPFASEPARERQAFTARTARTARVSAGSPPGPEPALAAGEGLEIRVVTGTPAKPVPDALVAFIDERSVVDEDMLEVRAGTLTIDQILERVGRRYRADERGSVRVPVPHGFGFVAGGTPELWGMLEFPEDETDLVLILQPDPPLVVRVVDTDGRPVGGVPVAFRQRYEQFVQDLFATTTAPETGRATLRHIRRFVEEKRQDGQTFVALAVLGKTPVEVAIDPENFPDEPLELVLPLSGSVELRIEDADGQPFEDPVVVRMIEQPEAGRPAAFRREQRVHLVARGGRLLVPHVGLGLDLALLLEAQGYAPLNLEQRGPVSPGERVTIRASLEDLVPSLTGIAVDAEGNPLAGVGLVARITVETAENKSDRTHSRLRTDEEGRFREALPPAWNELAGRFTLELGTEDAAGRQLAASVTLPGRPLNGENDLGTVVLTPPPLLAAGAVVDPEGLPVAGAQVVLAVPRENSGGGPTHWRTVWEHRTRSDRTGAFEFRGVLDEPRIAVSATHPDHSGSRRIEAAPGTSSLRVVLTRAGRLAGSLLVDEGVSYDLFAVQAQHESEPRSVYHAEVRKDGTFELTSMDEGPYRLTVALRDEAGCGEVIEGVLVRAGQAGDDERLQAIDLRGRIRAFTLEVVDEAGTPLMQGALSRKTPETAEFGAERIWLRGGQAKIATCLPALDLEIDVPGYRTQLLEGIAEDRRVTLARGPRLSIVLQNAPALKPDAVLGVQVRLAEPGRWKPTQTTWIENGHALLHAKGAGTHEVTVIYAEVGEEVRRSHPVSSGPEARIEVADSSELQEFVVELSETTLRRLEEL